MVVKVTHGVRTLRFFFLLLQLDPMHDFGDIRRVMSTEWYTDYLVDVWNGESNGPWDVSRRKRTLALLAGTNR